MTELPEHLLGHEHVDIGVDETGNGVDRQRGDKTVENLVDVATHPPRRVRPGHLGCPGEAGDRTGFRWNAGGQPVEDVGIVEVQRLDVDADSSTMAGIESGRGTGTGPRTSHTISEVIAITEHMDISVRPGEAVAIAVDVQAQTGSGAEIDQRQRPAALAGDEPEHRQHVGTTADLVHLVAVGAAQIDQGAALGATEVSQRLGGSHRRRRLLAAGSRVVPGQRLGIEPGDEKGDAALSSSGGSRSSGIAAARPERISSSAMERNVSAVNRHEAGASGGDHAAAISRA